ncbi:hypothetical protein [Sphingobacterium sp. MYb382]|uniref:hypothetical protein n=1 Tax=Sphingobacterium sp. MYb382 TaxID=2745278 RepID=UPI0030A5FF23
MVENFTQKENDTEVGEGCATTIVAKTTDNFEDCLKTELNKLVREPNPKTIAHLLNFSKNLHR